MQRVENHSTGELQDDRTTFVEFCSAVLLLR
jgi:hypothetical protein